MSLDALLEIELIELSKSQRGVFMKPFQFQNILPPMVDYDWHVKAYAVYLLRQKGIYIEFDGAIK